MQLRKGWQFELTSSTTRNFAHFGGCFGTSIQNRKVVHARWDIHSQEFGTHDLQVETNVLPHYKTCLFQGDIELCDHIFQIGTFLHGQLGGNSVNPFCIVRNIESNRFD